MNVYFNTSKCYRQEIASENQKQAVSFCLETIEFCLTNYNKTVMIYFKVKVVSEYSNLRCNRQAIWEHSNITSVWCHEGIDLYIILKVRLLQQRPSY